MKLFFIILAFMSISGCFPKPQPPIPPIPPIPPEPPAPINPTCYKPGTLDFSKPGPYQIKRAYKEGNIWFVEPIVNDCQMPIVHYSNGTGAACAYYHNINRHLASYGFLALCYESRNTGSGQQCLSAIKTAINKFGKKITPYILSTGHSQGGGGAHACHYLLEKEFPDAKVVSVGHCPAHCMNNRECKNQYESIRGSVLMLSGNLDRNVPIGFVRFGFRMVKTDKTWFEAQGINHFNMHRPFMAPTISFAGWKLFDDEKALNYLQNLPKSNSWKKIDK